MCLYINEITSLNSLPCTRSDGTHVTKTTTSKQCTNDLETEHNTIGC